MFGLFRTRKNPKGPNIEKVQNLCFELGDSRLYLSLPYGNHSSLENISIIEQKINIFDINRYEYEDKNDISSFWTILQRHYQYSYFNWPGFAGINVMLTLNRFNQVDNLLDEKQLSSMVSKNANISMSVFNNKASEDCKLTISKDFSFMDMNHERLLTYETSQFPMSGTTKHYLAAIAPQHCFDLSFRYPIISDTDETWYKMAQALEKQILSSLKLALDDSLSKLRETSSPS